MVYFYFIFKKFLICVINTVIGQVIPMVGYYTNMDIFITLVFLLLSFTVAIHFITLILIKRSGRYPLLNFVNDLMVFIFRLVWIPMVGYEIALLSPHENSFVHYIISTTGTGCVRSYLRYHYNGDMAGDDFVCAYFRYQRLALRPASEGRYCICMYVCIYGC